MSEIISIPDKYSRETQDNHQKNIAKAKQILEEQDGYDTIVLSLDDNPEKTPSSNTKNLYETDIIELKTPLEATKHQEKPDTIPKSISDPVADPEPVEVVEVTKEIETTETKPTSSRQNTKDLLASISTRQVISVSRIKEAQEKQSSDNNFTPVDFEEETSKQVNTCAFAPVDFKKEQANNSGFAPVNFEEEGISTEQKLLEPPNSKITEQLPGKQHDFAPVNFAEEKKPDLLQPPQLETTTDTVPEDDIDFQKSSNKIREIFTKFSIAEISATTKLTIEEVETIRGQSSLPETKTKLETKAEKIPPNTGKITKKATQTSRIIDFNEWLANDPAGKKALNRSGTRTKKRFSTQQMRITQMMEIKKRNQDNE